MKELEDVNKIIKALEDKIEEKILMSNDMFTLYMNIANLRKKLSSNDPIYDKGISSFLDRDCYYNFIESFYIEISYPFIRECNVEFESEASGAFECINFPLYYEDIDKSFDELTTVYKSLEEEYEKILDKNSERKRENDLRNLKVLANDYGYELIKKEK